MGMEPLSKFWGRVPQPVQADAAQELVVIQLEEQVKSDEDNKAAVSRAGKRAQRFTQDSAKVVAAAARGKYVPRLTIDDELFRKQHIDDVQVAVTNALSQLDETSRTCLVLVAREELSYKDIADQLHVTVATVRNRISRAKNVLRTVKALKELFND